MINPNVTTNPDATSSGVIAKHGESWRHWVINGLSAGCDPKAMLAKMTESVWVSDDATLALEEGLRILGIKKNLRASRPKLSLNDQIELAGGHVVTVLSRIASPSAALLANVLTTEECAELIECAQRKGLRDSSVVDVETGQSVLHHARTSTGVFFARSETALIEKLERRLAQLTGWDVDRAEGLQVLCYTQGQQYIPHFDWFNPAKPGSALQLKRGGQRVGTTVIYLANAESGGGTSFPKVGVEIKPPVGGAVFFNNVDALGTPDDMSLHGGTPVVTGVKIVATYWQRAEAFDKRVPRFSGPIMAKHRYAPIEGRVEHIQIRSGAISNNLLGDTIERIVTIYLPPGYENGGEFPLFVDLAGFNSSGPAHAGWRAFDENLPHRLERLVKEGKMGPVVLAMPDCFTSLGGNQYINSAVIGNWADFLIGEMLPEIEARYRVRKGPNGRAVFGKSSGGYGALAHGLLYGEHWGAIACHSGDMLFQRIFLPEFPKVLSTLAVHNGDPAQFIEHVQKALTISPQDVRVLMMLAKCATFDPDLTAPFGVQLPVDLHTCELIDSRWQRWLNWDPVQLAERVDCLVRLRGLKGIFIDCGANDQFRRIWGARAISRRLMSAGVKHHYEEFDDNHSGIDYRLDTSLPYLFSALQSGTVAAVPAVGVNKPKPMSFDDRVAIDAAVRDMMQTDRAAAAELAHQWVKAKPRYTHARVMYAWTLASTGHEEGAIRELRRCITEAPSHNIETRLALAYHRVGDYTGSLEQRLKALEYPEREPRDALLASFAANILGQRDLARSLYFAEKSNLATPEGIFGQFLLESTNSGNRKAIRKQLLALGERSDAAVLFWKEFDAHPFRVMDNKRGLNALIRKGCKSRPDWWPETYDLPDLDGSTAAAVAAAGPALWIYKRSNLIATQRCRVGRGALTDWLPSQDLAADAILQRYMDAPYLVEGRKFNVRLQMCLQAPFAEAAFLWNDGLVFIATSLYQPESFNTDRAAHFVNPITARRDVLSTPIGPYPAPGIALRQFLELTFDAPTRKQVMDTMVGVASEVAKMLEASGLFEAILNTPNWRAFPPKFFGLDMSFDENLRPWLFELERYPGMGVGSPSSKEVLERFRRDWLPFAMGLPSKEFIPLC